MAVKNVSSQNPSIVSSTSGRDGAAAVQTNKAAGALAGLNPKPTGSVDNKGVDVSLSDNAKTRIQEHKKAKEIAMNTPDVREDRVAAIKSQIQAGTYKVDSGKIADGMVREAVMEHLAGDWKK